jgi:hypothetical protein
MKSTELLSAGYNYINIDDCWSSPHRVDGKLVPHPTKFPKDPDVRDDDGMISVVKHVKALGFRLGIYSDMGARTCGQYPGFLQLKEEEAAVTALHARNKIQGLVPITNEVSAADAASENSYATERQDGNTQKWMEERTYLVDDLEQFIAWGVESLKVDGCGISPSKMADLYSALSDEIMDRTTDGNRILLSCSWPAYTRKGYENPDDIKILQEKCNLWRNTFDINDSWDTVKMIVNFFARKDPNDIMVASAGPGHWNDPDMLVIGTPGLSVSEQRAQFALWAILAAPLYISADVAEMQEKYPESLKILLNKKVIDVNQDPLGKQGFVLREDDKQGNLRVWIRRLVPKNGVKPRLAVLFQNFYNAFNAHEFSLRVEELGWPSSREHTYSVDDLHTEEGTPLRELRCDEPFKVTVDENSVMMFVFEWNGPSIEKNLFEQSFEIAVAQIEKPRETFDNLKRRSGLPAALQPGNTKKKLK